MPTGYIINLPEPPQGPQAKGLFVQFATEEILRKPTLEDLRGHSIHIMHQRFFANYEGIFRRKPDSWRTPGVVYFCEYLTSDLVCFCSPDSPS